MISRKTGKIGKNVRVNFKDAFEGIKKQLYYDAAKALKVGFSSIVNGTPVDTGYAISNWRVVTGDSTRGSVPTEKDGGPYKDPGTVISDGNNVINIMKKYGFKDNFVFFNPVPYMARLEYGHSSQNKFWIKASVSKMASTLSSLKK